MTAKHVYIQQNGRLMLVIVERPDEISLDLKTEGLSPVQLIRLLGLALSYMAQKLGEEEISLFRTYQNQDEHPIATVFCDIERARVASHTPVTGEEMVILLCSEIVQRIPEPELTIELFPN